MEPSFLVGYIVLGACAGFLAGLLGIGGGMVMVPFLAMSFTAQGHPYATLMQVVLATAMATIMFTSLSSARAHHAKGNVRWDLVKLLVPGALIGCLLGSTILAQLPTRFIKIFFALFLLFSSFKMLRSASAIPAAQLPAPPRIFGFGILLGAISSMLGAGGAFVAVPWLSARSVDARHAIGTSSALGVPIALFATVGYVINGWKVPNLPTPNLGFVYLPALTTITLASVVTAPIGAKFTQKFPVATLKRFFALMLLALAVRMFWMAANR